MSSSASSSPPSSPSSPLTLEGFQLLTVQTISAPAHGPGKGPEDNDGTTSNRPNPVRSLSQDSQSSFGSRGHRIAGRASVTLLRVSDIRLSNRASWSSATSSPPSSARSTMPDNSPLQEPQTPTQTTASQDTYTRTRSIARASRPPALPLASSSHDGLGSASGSPPERLSVRAPTPPKSRRQRTFTVPPDAAEPRGASGAAAAGAAPATPTAPEPTSAHSHRSFATFGGGREADSPRTKDPPLPMPPSAPHPAPSPRARHQSLDTRQAPLPIPPRLSSISHSGLPNLRKELVPTRTSSLATTGSGGAAVSNAAKNTPQASVHAQVSSQHQTHINKPQHVKDDSDSLGPSPWGSRRARGSNVYDSLGGSKSCVELVRVNDNPLGHQLEPADEHDALTDSPSVDHNMMSESGLSIAPLLPRSSADSHARPSVSFDSEHTRPILLPNPQEVVRLPQVQHLPPRSKPRVRISQSVDGHSLSTSTLEQQQKALLIRRNRKLGQVLGVSLPESDVGQYVVEPSVASTTVLTKVEAAWPENRGPEWSQDDCVPHLADDDDRADRMPRRTKSKLRRPVETVKLPENLQVYVSRETSVTETVAPASQSNPLDSAPSSPPTTPHQTREEAIRARRRAQLAKLQRILGSPISPRLVLAPEDDVPTCGPVRSPTETSLGSPRLPLRERVKSFVIPSPIFAMSETERRLARKRASKLEHLFGDAPPTEMIFPPSKHDAGHKHALDKIRECAPADGTAMGVPGIEENRMFISTSPAAAVYHTPEETFEGYRHSLLGLMHLIEHDQIRLAHIVDQLEPQLYNLHIQSSLALQMPRHPGHPIRPGQPGHPTHPNANANHPRHPGHPRGGQSDNVVLNPNPAGLQRRSSAPPLPNFSRMNGAPGAQNPAQGASNANGASASTHDHNHRQGKGHTPHASVSSTRDEPRPSLQLQRGSHADPFSEYMKTQSRWDLSVPPHEREPSSATNSTVRGAPASSQGHGHEKEREVLKDIPKEKRHTGPYGAHTGHSPRKLSGFFGKPKTPTARNHAANGSMSVMNLSRPQSGYVPHPHHPREHTTTVEKDDSPPGTAKKRGRKFSKLFSGHPKPPQQPMILRPNPFYIRRQTLDGVLAELRRSFLLDLDHGRLRPHDAHILHDMLELLNHMRAGSPWAELEDSEW